MEFTALVGGGADRDEERKACTGGGNGKTFF